jgi:hypothetical protein
MNCDARCTALSEEYGSDRELLDFLKRRLLKRGWAGKLTEAERAHVKVHVDWATRDGLAGVRVGGKTSLSDGLSCGSGPFVPEAAGRVR